MTRVSRLNVAAGLTVATALVAYMPSPARVSLPDREAQRVWSAQLDRDFGPVLADCVRFEVEGHVPPLQLEATYGCFPIFAKWWMPRWRGACAAIPSSRNLLRREAGRMLNLSGQWDVLARNASPGIAAAVLHPPDVARWAWPTW